MATDVRGRVLRIVVSITLTVILAKANTPNSAITATKSLRDGTSLETPKSSYFNPGQSFVALCGKSTQTDTALPSPSAKLERESGAANTMRAIGLKIRLRPSTAQASGI